MLPCFISPWLSTKCWEDLFISLKLILKLNTLLPDSQRPSSSIHPSSSNDFKIKENNSLVNSRERYLCNSSKRQAKALVTGISGLSRCHILRDNDKCSYNLNGSTASPVPVSKGDCLPTDIGNECISKLNPFASIFVPSTVITLVTQHESNTVVGMSRSQLNPMNNINCDTYGNNSKIDSVSSITTDVNNSLKPEPLNTLKRIRISNVNRIIIGQLNINSIRNKFDDMKFIVTGNFDILVITESKLDRSFPANQFIIEGFSPPFRADRDSKGGGVLIYAREDIACRELKCHSSLKCIEGIFIEMNLNTSKWLLFGGYNPTKDRISDFVIQVGSVLDYYMPRYENFLLLRDFNSEMSEFALSEFCQMYNLTNLIKEPTCFKNPSNPSLIDLILTNRDRSFQNSQVIETGLSDHHKLTITILKISEASAHNYYIQKLQEL